MAFVVGLNLRSIKKKKKTLPVDGFVLAAVLYAAAINLDLRLPAQRRRARALSDRFPACIIPPPIHGL